MKNEDSKNISSSDASSEERSLPLVVPTPSMLSTSTKEDKDEIIAQLLKQLAEKEMVIKEKETMINKLTTSSNIVNGEDNNDTVGENGMKGKSNTIINSTTDDDAIIDTNTNEQQQLGHDIKNSIARRRNSSTGIPLSARNTTTTVLAKRSSIQNHQSTSYQMLDIDHDPTKRRNSTTGVPLSARTTANTRRHSMDYNNNQNQYHQQQVSQTSIEMTASTPTSSTRRNSLQHNNEAYRQNLSAPARSSYNNNVNMTASMMNSDNASDVITNGIVNTNSRYFQTIDTGSITTNIVAGIMQRRLSTEGIAAYNPNTQVQQPRKASIGGAIAKFQRRLSNGGGVGIGGGGGESISEAPTGDAIQQPQSLESIRHQMEREMEEGRQLIRSMTDNKNYSAVDWDAVMTTAKSLQEKEHEWINLKSSKRIHDINMVTFRQTFLSTPMNVIDEDDDATYCDDDNNKKPSVDKTMHTDDDNKDKSDNDEEDDTETNTEQHSKRVVPFRTEQEILDELLNDTDLNRPHPSLECPPFYFILQAIHPRLLEGVKKLYKIRWSLSYPLQRRIPASKWLSNHFGGIFLTWGELIMIIPFFVFMLMAILGSFINPSVSITGQACRTPLIFAFLTAMRNSYITLILGMPFERGLWYHKLSGRIAFIAGIFHTYVCFYHPVASPITGVVSEKAATGSEKNFGIFLFDDSVNIGGTCLFFSICIIVITSLPYIRRTIFELFFYTHVVFAAACVACAFYHTGILVPILVSISWGLDLLIRKFYMAGCRYPKTATIRTLSDSVVEVSFPKTKDFDYNPGQYVRLSIPEISIFEWHPFSLSSCPLEDTVTLHIRTAGAWTKSLYQLADNAITRERKVSILVEGPYGSVGVDLESDRYKMIMLFSGGIGVTPMQSLCNQLVFENTIKAREIKKLGFYWMERDPTAMQEMDVSRRGSSLHESLRDLSDSIHGSSLADPEDIEKCLGRDSFAGDDYSSNEEGSNAEFVFGNDFDDLQSLSVQSMAKSVKSDFFSQGKPMSIAQTVLSFVPQSKITDEELEEAYPSEEFDAEYDDRTTSLLSLVGLANKDKMARRNSLNQRIGSTIDVIEEQQDSSSNGSENDVKDTYVGTLNHDNASRDNDSASSVDDDSKTYGDIDSSSASSHDDSKTYGDIESKNSSSSGSSSGDSYEILRTKRNDTRPSLQRQENNRQLVSPYDVLDMNFFLTAKNVAATNSEIANHDYVTLGRPDLHKNFEKMKQDAINMGECRVAVCICAPARLVHICKKACVKFSDNQVRFDLHEEIFG